MRAIIFSDTVTRNKYQSAYDSSKYKLVTCYRFCYPSKTLQMLQKAAKANLEAYLGPCQTSITVQKRKFSINGKLHFLCSTWWKLFLK